MLFRSVPTIPTKKSRSTTCSHLAFIYQLCSIDPSRVELYLELQDPLILQLGNGQSLELPVLCRRGSPGVIADTRLPGSTPKVWSITVVLPSPLMSSLEITRISCTATTQLSSHRCVLSRIPSRTVSCRSVSASEHIKTNSQPPMQY